MQHLWQRMSMNRFVVLGRVGLDLYADPPGTRIEDAQGFRTAIGGSAGNIAVALARQGARAALLTRVSDDAVGRFCAAELARYGVDCDHIGVLTGEARTSLAVTESRSPDCQVVLYRNGAADFGLMVADVEPVDFAPVSALVVTGTALAADPSRRATLAAMAKARASGALVVLDIDHRAYSWASRSEAQAICLAAARSCDIVIGNDEEFGLLAGAMDQGRALAQHLAASRMFTVYKEGAKGCTTFTADFSFASGIFPVRPLKPMGAGDGFLAGVLAGLAQGQTLAAAVQRGAATAAIIVAGFGCAPASPIRAELDHFLTEHS